MMAMLHFERPAVVRLICVIILLANGIILASLFAHTKYTTEHGWKYSYTGSDFPSRFDAPDNIAEMTFGESTIFDLDIPHAAHLWNSIRPNVHLGYVRLGEEDRLLVVSLYHALHCLTIFRRALVQDASLSDHHFEHCMNYLRQLFLCSADATLEPIDFRPVNHSFVSPSYNRQCRDWSAVFAAVDDNYSNWISGANHSAGGLSDVLVA